MDNDLQKKFDSLPEDLKEAITSVDFSETLQTIGKNSDLHLDQLDQLFEEVGLVMLGITHPNQFGPKVAKLFNLSESGKNLLVKAVDEKIFQPIHTSLMKLHEKTTPSEQTVSPNLTETSPPTNVIPHESDYSMSREDILSAIENPTATNSETEYTPRKVTFETNDPHDYLEKRENILKKIEDQLLKIDAPIPKHSLSEEAVLIARKKTEKYPQLSKQPETKPHGVEEKKEDERPTQIISPVQILPKPMDKLEKVTHVGKQVINIPTPNIATPQPPSSTPRSVDPYREIA